MKVIFIIGPQAVGKMTIGEQISKQSGVPLLYNHMTKDVLVPFVGWGEQNNQLSDKIRLDIFDTIASNPKNPGIIFTVVINFGNPEDKAVLDHYEAAFTKHGVDVHFIELEADLEERLRRNKTEHRMEMKPVKRNLEFSENEILDSVHKNRLASLPGEMDGKHYLRLDVTNLSAEEAAEKIVEFVGE